MLEGGQGERVSAVASVHLPFAEDDVEVGAVETGDRHVGQFKLLQLPHDFLTPSRRWRERESKREREREKEREKERAEGK